MKFEKSNNKKNYKIISSITLAIILLVASSVTILSFVKNEAFAQMDPVDFCLNSNGSQRDSAYSQAINNFIQAVPNDQVLVNIAHSHNLPFSSTYDLTPLLRSNALTSNDLDNISEQISNLLASAGFTSSQQNGLHSCIMGI
jgi:hypothetical protein